MPDSPIQSALPYPSFKRLPLFPRLNLGLTGKTFLSDFQPRNVSYQVLFDCRPERVTDPRTVIVIYLGLISVRKIDTQNFWKSLYSL